MNAALRVVLVLSGFTAVVAQSRPGSLSVTASKSSKYSGLYEKFKLHRLLQPIAQGAVIFNESINALDISQPLATTVRQNAPGAFGICPPLLKLNLTTSSVPIPDGIQAPNSSCAPSSALAPSSLLIGNSTPLLERLISLLLGDSFASFQTEFLTVNFPPSVLQCRADNGAPFEMLAFLPLSHVILVHLHTILTAHGMRSGTFSFLFNPQGNATSNLWNSSYAIHARAGVRKAMLELESIPMAVLFRGSGNSFGPPPGAGADFGAGPGSVLGPAPGPISGSISGPPPGSLTGNLNSIFSSQKPPCMYTGGKTYTLNDVIAKVDALAVAMVPLFAHLFAHYESPPPMTLFPTDDRCNQTVLQGLDSLTLAGGSLSVVQEKTCNSLSLQPFHEAEFKYTNGSTLEKLTVNITNFIVQLRTHAGSPAQKVIMQSDDVNQSRLFSSAIHNVAMKTTIRTGYLNLTDCANSSSYVPKEMVMILVQSPVSFFFCNGFSNLIPGLPYPCTSDMTGRTTLKRADNGLYNRSQPPLNDTKQAHTFNVDAQPMLQTGFSAIISTVMNSTPVSCVFSYNETEARDIRVSIKELMTAKKKGQNFSLPHESSPSPSISPAASKVFILPSGVVPDPVKLSTPTPSTSTSPSPSASKSVPAKSVQPNTTNNSNGGGVCFPGHAEVFVRNVGRVTMDQLRIGDEIAVGRDKFETVLLFTHTERNVRTEMVHLRGQNFELILSPSHYIILNGHLQLASEIRIGDHVLGRDGKKHEVENMNRIEDKGLFNPQTNSGTFLVAINGKELVHVSAYTSAIRPSVAHAFLAPVRGLHELTGSAFFFLSELFSSKSFIEVMGNMLSNLNRLKKIDIMAMLQVDVLATSLF